MWKKLLPKALDSESTPRAPKPKPLPLPEVEESDIVPPPLVESWTSSDSGSSVSSSSPSTPSSSPAPWRRRTTTPYKPPAIRSPTPQHDMRSPSWNVMTSDLEKSLCRQTMTPSPEIHKPKARHAPSIHHPTPVQVMQGLVSPGPIPPKPIKSILKHTSPPPCSPSPAPPPRRVNQVMLHWQLCPYDTHKADRQLRVEFDVTKPVELVVIRDLKQPYYASKLSKAKVNEYLQRSVCEGPPLRKMSIRYPKFPKWVVTVARSDGGPIVVRDVFQALFEDMHKVATRQDRMDYIPKGMMPQCEQAFARRCEASTRSVATSEMTAGMRRVDLLMGDSVFTGLTRPDKDDQDFWIANFGPASSLQ